MAHNTTLLWRIRPLMVEREIYTVRELHRRLQAVGYTISEVQLGRVRKALPKLLDTQLLAALCNVLAVSPGDLLVRKGDGAYGLSMKPTTRQERVEAVLVETPIATRSEAVIPTKFPLSGPKVGAMRVREPKP